MLRVSPRITVASMSIASSPAVTSNDPFKATLWMMGATMSFIAMAVSGREAGQILTTAELLVWRSVLGLGVTVALMLMFSRSLAEIRTKRPGLHLIRNLFHFFGQYGWYAAVVLIPLAPVFALEFTSPVWVMLAAPFLLGERFTRWKILAVVMGFTGMLLIVKPGFVEISEGTIWAFFCAFGFAGTIIATKKLSATETPFCILFYMTLLQGPMGLAVIGDLPTVPPSLDIWLWTIGLALGGLSSHYCLARAYMLADATVVVPLDFTRLPLIAIVGLVAYGEAIDIAVIAGGALIVFGNVMNIRAERKRRRQGG